MKARSSTCHLSAISHTWRPY